MEIILQAFGWRDTGKEVITTPFTFVSTTNSIVRNGLVPKFCDIRPEDYTIDPDKLEALITDKTVAIMPVHVYGNICEIERIDEIAKKHDLKVIYDGAHAFGVKYNGKGIGNYGDAVMYSFHATKVFNTIEGGAVTFKDPDYIPSFTQLMNFGICGEDVTAAGGNAKMDEFRAAMGLCNLRSVNSYIEKRKQVFERYISNLRGVPGIELIKYKAGVSPNYAYFPVVFDKNGFGETRDDVFDRLAKKDIFARKYFYPATNDFSAFAEYEHGDTPIASRVSKNVLCLPMYADLSIEEVDYITDVLLEKQ